LVKSVILSESNVQNCPGYREVILEIINNDKSDKEEVYTYKYTFISIKPLRAYAYPALAKLQDKNSLKILLEHLATEKTESVREEIVLALGHYPPELVEDVLSELLKKSSNERIRANAVRALGNCIARNKVKEVTSILLNDNSYLVRSNAIYALSYIGGNAATLTLIETMKNDPNTAIKIDSILALGCIGGRIAMNPLIRYMNENNNPYCAIALLNYTRNALTDALIEASENSNEGALFSLAYFKGGNWLSRLDESTVKLKYNYLLRPMIDAYWGRGKTPLENIFKDIDRTHDNYIVRLLLPGVISKIEAPLPQYNFEADYHTRQKQARLLKEWYIENRQTIKWEGSMYLIK